MRKVTAKSKIVTSKTALAMLEKQGIDKDYVEFIEDYSKKHPTRKRYRDKKSGLIMNIYGKVPRVDKSGKKIDCSFTYDDKYISGHNFFKCEVDGEKVTVEFEDKKTEYSPELFIDGKKINFEKPELKSTEGYTNNLIEYKSDKCIRRIKITQGNYRENWEIFEKGNIEVKHNFIGDDLIKIGTGYDIKENKINIQVDKDSELFSGDAEFPIFIGGATIFYVDGTTVDGYCQKQVSSTGSTFEDLVNADGDGSYDTGTAFSGFTLRKFDATYWKVISRGFVLFNTADLDEDANIYATNLSLYCSSKSDLLVIDPDFGIYEADPASDDALVYGDYQEVGSILCSNELALSDVTTSAYFTFNLNAYGRSKVIGGDVSKFSIRSAADATITDPGGVSGQVTFINIKSYLDGTLTEPKLTVFYRNLTEYIDVESGYDLTLEVESGGDLR